MELGIAQMLMIQLRARKLPMLDIANTFKLVGDPDRDWASLPCKTDVMRVKARQGEGVKHDPSCLYSLRFGADDDGKSRVQEGLSVPAMR
jgi:hypothetical protein